MEINPLMEKIGTAVIGMLIAVAAYFIKEFLSSGKQALSKQDNATAALTKQMHEFTEEFSELRLKIVSTISSLELQIKESLNLLDKNTSAQLAKHDNKIDLLATGTLQYNKDLAKLEGRLDEHMGLISSQISTTRNFSDKFTRLFEFVDAKARATDQIPR